MSRPRSQREAPPDTAALHDLFVATTPGLEALALREIAALLPHASLRAESGGIALGGSLADAFALNLGLRTASRVLVRLARFRAAHFAELERHARTVAWNRIASPGSALGFAVTSRKSRLYHTGAIAERLFAAAAQAVPGIVQATDEAPGTRIVVRVVRDEVTLSADTSGEHLHVRGPRVATGEAPLRETIAAALLLQCGWDPSTPMIDPLCGSGTIACEAASLARERAPGILRSFALEAWPDFDRADADSLRAIARAREHPAQSPIVASDHSSAAVANARANVGAAGLADTIDVAVARLAEVHVPTGCTRAGWIVTNPPWGLRLGDEGALRDLYATLGRVGRERFPGWGLAFITPSPRLAAATGGDPACLAEFRQGGVNLGIWASPG